MKLLQEMEDGQNDRKFIKSQVEKRRRERMNRSLECLRTMLLQEPQQQGGTQRRVEKAEILEHTVVFLQNTPKEDKTRAGGGGGGEGGGGGGGGGGDGGGNQKPSFQDGFSTCLQRAAQFLGPEGKGLWLGTALDASFSARFSRSDSDSAAVVQRRAEARSSSTSSLPQTKSILRLLRQRSKHKLSTRACGVNTSVHPYQCPNRKGFLRVPQQPQNQSLLELRAVTQNCPLSQTLWRPWP